MGVLHSFSIKNISYGKMDLGIFYFDVGVSHIYGSIYIYMVLTTEGFFEVAIESWPE